MKIIPLSQGKSTIVDDEDYEWLNKYSWCYHVDGYAFGYIKETKKRQMMHRLILKAPANKEVDHINRDRLDNRRSNLRLCTHSQNHMNEKIHCDNRTGYKGIWQRKNRWVAAIYPKPTFMITLGSYKTKEEAARAYDEAAKKYYGEFALLNFPNE